MHVLDDQEGGVDAGSFGDGIHEGIVSLMDLDYLEYFLDSMV